MYSDRELIAKIKIIFDKEKKEIVMFRRALIKLNRNVGPKGIYGPTEYDKICLDVPNTHLIYDNLDLLIKLYSKISSNPNLKKLFLDQVTSNIENNIYFERQTGLRFNIAGLAVFFLFRINKLDILEKAIEKRKKNKLLSDNIDSILVVIKDILIYEHYKLNEENIILLKKIVDNLITIMLGHSRRFFMREDYDSRINETIEGMDNLFNDLEVHRLKIELSDNLNYEINQDKEIVQKYILEYKIDETASLALNKIDQSYYDISEESFDLRNSISLLKEVFDKVTKSIMDDLIQFTGEKPTKISNEHPTETKHRFIEEKLIFNEGEKRMMGAVNQMLNEEKHSFMSKKEKFRITRNVTIEFLLLLFSKLDKFKENGKR